MPRDGLGTKTAIIEVAQRPPGAPVGALRRLPDGRTWALSQFQIEGEPMRYMVLGSWSGCQILVDHESVSRQHCIVERHPSGDVIVHDCGSKNGTRINAEPVQSGVLLEGSLLSVGEITLLACDEASEAMKMVLAATSVHSLIQNALLVYGSVRKAARGLGVSSTTLYGWSTKKFCDTPPDA